MASCTASKDGKMRYTIRVRHRIGKEELVDSVARHFIEDGELVRGRSQAWRLLREDLRRAGCNVTHILHWEALKECYSDFEEKCLKARDRVTALFPELD